MTGGEALVKTLLAHGVTQGFGVPARATLPSWRGCSARARFRLVVTRHESGATFAAEAYGKLRGGPPPRS